MFVFIMIGKDKNDVFWGRFSEALITLDDGWISGYVKA
jgi:hypothetical protein